jgi:hypothetical protein
MGGGGGDSAVTLSLRGREVSLFNNAKQCHCRQPPHFYIVTLFPKFDHFIQIPVADVKCPQQQTALVGFFLQMLCKIFLNRTDSCKGGGRLYCGTAGS